MEIGGTIMKPFSYSLGLVLAAAALQATPVQAQDAKAGDLQISFAWCRAIPIQSDASCYLTIENKGAAADRLVGVSSDLSEKAEVRQIITGGGFVDKPVAGGLPISAGDKVALTPLGYHVVLLNTKAALKKGAKQQITLEFEKAGKVPVSFDVLAATSKGPPMPKADNTMMKK
jgi:copper(I)-binding protein